MAQPASEEPRTGYPVRVLSWNVNGLRNCAAKFGGLGKMLDALGADVICFQEHKTLRKDLEQPLAVVDGWDAFFAFHRGNTGYSGVVTFCRTAAGTPVHAEEGLTGSRSQALTNPLWAGYTVDQLMALDQEGRVVITDHGEFVLFNIYAHALSNEETFEERRALKRLFYEALRSRVEAYQCEGRRCVIVGDWNICPRPLDHRQPEPDEEWFSGDPSSSLVSWLYHMSHDGPDKGPWVDTFRLFHPTRPQAYTCWSTASGARVHNWGSRIDLIVATGPGPVRGCDAETTVRDWVVNGDVWQDMHGSDHCPVWADLLFPQPLPKTTPTNKPLPLNSRNLFLGKQARLTQWLSTSTQGPQLARAASSGGGAGLGSRTSSGNGCAATAAKGHEDGEQALHREQGKSCTADHAAHPQLPSAPSCSGGVGVSDTDVSHDTGGALLSGGVAVQAGSAMRHQGAMGKSGVGVGKGGSGAKPTQAKLTAFVKRASPAPVTAAQPAVVQGAQSGATQPGTIQPQLHPHPQPQPQMALAADRTHGMPTSGAMQPGTLQSQPQTQFSVHLQPRLQPQSQPAVHSQDHPQGSALQQATEHPWGLEASGSQGVGHSVSQCLTQGQGVGQGVGYSVIESVSQSESQGLSQVLGGNDRNAEAAKAWRSIQQRMQAPRCTGHNETAVIRQVKKAGPNHGRTFYVCARPDGPAPVGRCDFFVWADNRVMSQNKGTSTGSGSGPGARGGRGQGAGAAPSAKKAKRG